MMGRRVLGTLAVVCLLAAPAAAQDPEPAGEGSSSGLGAFGGKVVRIFSAPLHPVIESVGPGGGFGPGIAYRSPGRSGGPWSFAARAVITPRKYWLTQTRLTHQNDWLHAEFYGRARDMKRLNFFGIGADTAEEDRTNYRFLDRSAGVLASVRFPAFDVLAVGGRLEELWPELRGGQHDTLSSIEERFTLLDAPGLDVQPRFTSATVFANLNYPGGNALGRHGFDVQVAYTAYRDHDAGTYNFNRVSLESQQRIRGVHPDHTLTLHQWFVTSGEDDLVPLYFQHTLGGVGAVRAVGEEIIGSDGTKATLRGLQDLRFRGPHHLLLQAEYRFKVWGPFDVTGFVDSGMSARRRGEIGLDGLRTSAGFSLSLMTIDATALRVDVAGGGGEGGRVFFSVGPVFQRY